MKRAGEEEASSSESTKMDSARDASSRVASSDASSLEDLSVESDNTVYDASSCNRVPSDASSLGGPAFSRQYVKRCEFA